MIPEPGTHQGERGSSSRPLLARDGEVGAPIAAVESARRRNGQLAVVAGDAGIGKTRLLSEAGWLARPPCAHPRKIMLSGLESLTASERRVAQMAAEDVTNKEIPQALFVTVKTVEVHLSRVYRKIDIDSRRQLAGALSAPAAQAGVTPR